MNKKVKLIAIIGIMSAFSFILYAFEISVGFIIPSAAFLKIDFSDIPVFLTGLTLGPIPGVFVALIKNILHISITKEPALSGEIANFFASVAYMLPLSLMRLRSDKKLNMIISIVIAIISVTITLSIVNYFITLPLYGIEKSLRLPMIYATFIPFNIVRGTIMGVIIYFVYPRLKKTITQFINR
ncbi:MAG: ECF transporter S component [Erysipelotrichaceae bacterium]|nr:ECF transporter S component [Erysipelotrichaceae bacterium]MDD3923493.1 ECF transporter S component [Erysipelotrichaceae bacterium]MDD4642554.1 ECF transporter S component [Erysipelotrichaceae bacterium]